MILMLKDHIRKQKQKILDALGEAYPCDLCLREIADKIGASRTTASKYVTMLMREGDVEVTRRFGKMTFYRLRKERPSISQSKAMD